MRVPRLHEGALICGRHSHGTFKISPALVRPLGDRVIVMRAGEIIEPRFSDGVRGATKTDFGRELLAAVPRPPA